jgi:hypothetical protein
MKARWSLLLLMLATTGLGAEPALEFSGVLAAGSETRISLTDKASGESRWLKLGQDFGGYLVAAYEAPSETVVLTRDGQRFRLKLKDAKVKAGAKEPTPEIKKAILNNLRQLSAAADQFYLENGVAQTTYDQLVGADKYVKKIEALDGENYRQIVFKQGVAMSVTTASGYTTTYDP